MAAHVHNTKTKALLTLLNTLKNLNYGFKTISPLSHLRVNTRQNHPCARADHFTDPLTKLQNLRDIFGWSRSFKAAEIDPQIYSLMQEAEILRSEREGLYSTLRVSSYCYSVHSLTEKQGIVKGSKPEEQSLLFLHSAYPTTSNDSVFFGPDTYRYLNLIDCVMRERKPAATRRIVDIGCGAGPGAVLMALCFPEAEVFATDINEAALELTRVNAVAAGALNVTALYSDILNGVEGEFDVITANPPFLVDKEQRAYRHGGGDLGAALSFSMLKAAIPRLQPGGQFILYTGVAISDGIDLFKRDVSLYLNTLQPLAFTWQYQELDPDIFGEELFNDAYAMTDRIAAIALIVTLAA